MQANMTNTYSSDIPFSNTFVPSLSNTQRHRFRLSVTVISSSILSISYVSNDNNR
eukprot:c49521_g1_i1 orf=225-389(+)